MWFNVVVKGMFGLYCKNEEKSSPKRGRKLKSNVDFTNICWQNSTSTFTVLFYFKMTFGSRCSVEVPDSIRVWYCFFSCSRNYEM